MPASEQPWRLVDGGIAIAVRVTPKSSRDSVEGVDVRDGRAVLKVRVRAVPEDGKANAAVATVIARWLGVAKRSAAVTGGATSRDKSVTVTGEAGALVEAFNGRLAKGG